ncbi:hypothetical protein FZC84_02785 [Rossellomorea vietnamensis]|uniref:Uncharacterized protein n=1 Tax=Rossellomorea vietnamensis TaxID=218284 RepID=A0A5D4MIC8_9BACI|nr:hypothetical protein FZC84_02785 [Rossellomorea vietnamensis]
MPVGTEQGASTFYTGAAEEAHRPPRGVVRLERKSILFGQPQSLQKEPSQLIMLTRSILFLIRFGKWLEFGSILPRKP